MEAIKSYDRIDEKGFHIIGMGLSFAAMTYALKAICSFFSLSNLESFASFSVYVYWISLIITYMFKFTNSIKYMIMSEAVYGLLLSIGYICRPELRCLYADNFMFIRQIMAIYIPCGVVFATIKKYENCFEVINRTTMRIGFLLMVSFFMGYTTRWDYQYFGVQLSPAIFIAYYCFLNNGKKRYLLYVLIGFAFLLLGGRQSLVLCLIGCLILFNFKASSNHKIVFWFCVLLVICIIAISYDYVIYLLQTAINFDDKSYGKALQALLNGQLLDASNRSLIYEKSISIIRENGIKVNGFFADRLLLRKSVAHGDWIAYAHNIFLEILLDFGLLWGTLLIVAYVIMCVISYNRTFGEKRILGIVLFCLSFIRLFVSSSFLIEGTFYIHILFLFFAVKKRYNRFEKEG